MKRQLSSDKAILFSYFTLLILAGSLLLWLPGAWAGPGRLFYLDALFTSTSAVCVTGLITVDTAQYSRYGQIIIMALIQFGGLGIITFTTIYLIVPGLRISLGKSKMIRAYYTGTVEQNPTRIIRNILFFTFGIEAAGALLLYWGFSARGIPNAAFSAVFHTVSAFCNAGFSTFSDSLAALHNEGAILSVFMILIVMGGLSFVVIQELTIGLWKRKPRITFHTKVVGLVSLGLILTGGILYYLFERTNLLSAMPMGERLFAVMFQSVTPRTAGFNVFVQADMTPASKFLTMILMFIGGAPGSIAGGIKVTTFFIVLCYLLRHGNDYGEIVVGRRRLSAKSTSTAGLIILKAMGLIGVSAFFLTIFDGVSSAGIVRPFIDILFEVVSAFGTVGLSLGITPDLSNLGKITIIFTMFAGRVGVIAMALPVARTRREIIVYPEGNILMA
jgi:trk system potassium uptake protein TrkH